jgi:hypothetical protein
VCYRFSNTERFAQSGAREGAHVNLLFSKLFSQAKQKLRDDFYLKVSYADVLLMTAIR